MQKIEDFIVKLVVWIILGMLLILGFSAHMGRRAIKSGLREGRY